MTFLAWMDSRRNGGLSRVSAGLLAIVGVGVAVTLSFPIGGGRLSRYAELPPDDNQLAGFLVALLGPLAMTSVIRIRSDGEPRERMLGATFGVVVVGLFLCIPDTEMLRLIIVPVAGVALLVAIGLVRPFSRHWLLVATLILSWVGYRDGLERFSAMIGLAGCFVALSLVLLIPRAALPDRLSATTWLGFVPISAVVLSSRAAGVQPSTPVSIVLALLVIGGAVALLRADRFTV